MEAIRLGADGEQADLLILPGGGSRHPASLETIEKRMHYIKMQGNEVFKHAVRRMESASKECLEAASIPEEELSWIIPHQANIRILDAMGKRFKHLPQEKIYKTLQKYGNTSASSLGIALDEWRKELLGKKGDKILLTAFGGGLTWGAMVLSL
jgi:3-oxoacyl-[acyl-carrier-protein] synthase-3